MGGLERRYVRSCKIHMRYGWSGALGEGGVGVFVRVWAGNGWIDGVRVLWL